ncbi:MAG TPA: phosphate ABC transporter permease PstA [Stellaceae bacterium]|nr:phosphate ABC transporter permease PstA [Stellaceae bacterium]
MIVFDMGRYRGRRVRGRVILSLSLVATVIGLFFLAMILGTLVFRGAAAWSWALFAQDTPPPGSAGGLRNAIFGSLAMTAVGIVVGTPIGLFAGTYLAEYSRESKLGQAVLFVNDILLSAPSIIVGLFIYQLMVANMHHFSGWAGGMALAILVVPVVVRTTVEMLKLVPNTLREAASALGTPKWKIVTRVTYRAALQGLLTGVLLAVARISGETAPLLFTSLNNQFWSTDMNAPMANLPVVIFQFALSPYDDWRQLAWGGALLITVAILCLNIAARTLAHWSSLRS